MTLSSSRGQKLAALVGGLLCAASMPPFELLGGYAVLLGLALVVWSWQDCTPRRAAMHGWIAGLAHFGLTLEWIRYFGAIAVVPLICMMALTWAGTAACTRLISAPLSLQPIVAAVTWVAFEGVIAVVPFGGLPWAPVALSMHDHWVRDMASTAGIGGVSFLLVLAGAALAALVRRGAGVPLRRAGAVILAAALFLAIAGTLLRPTPGAGKRIRVAALQANIWNRDPTPEEIDSRRWLSDAHLNVAATLQGPLDLIIFPESSLDGNDLDQDVQLRGQLTDLARKHNAYVLANGIRYELGTGSLDEAPRYNTNWMFDPSGESLGTYDKRKLVPFGEYLPLRSLIDWIPETKRVGRFQPGDSYSTWNIKGTPIANIICFESVFGPYTRDAVRAADAQIIVVSTNNRSYQRSGASAQHVALGQFRSVELNRPVVHSADSGISAVISANGDVQETLDLFELGAIVRSVQGTTGDTLYSLWGDWFVLVCMWGTGISLLLAFVFKRLRSRSTNHDVPVTEEDIEGIAHGHL